MNLKDAPVGYEYAINKIDTEDTELASFLFSLGCHVGEKIKIISRRGKLAIISVKDARYCIDDMIAQTIDLEKQA